MTDVVALAKRQYNEVKWQNVQSDVTQEDLIELISEAIRYMYVIVGKGEQIDDSMFVYEEGIPVWFTEDLKEDEKIYVIMTAKINLLKMVQCGVDDLTSYTTDAMSVSHGDKPFANLDAMIDRAETERTIVWHRMIRYNLM